MKPLNKIQGCLYGFEIAEERADYLLKLSEGYHSLRCDNLALSGPVMGSENLGKIISSSIDHRCEDG